MIPISVIWSVIVIPKTTVSAHSLAFITKIEYIIGSKITPKNFQENNVEVYIYDNSYNSQRYCQKTRNATLQVSTDKGMVQGRQVDMDDGKSYFSFQGIPFALPPLNSLRFRSPQPMNRWKGVLDATRTKSGCIEMQIRFVGNVFHENGSEDCLYLNIYTPVVRNSRKNEYLPVIFYIYGGAFVEGATTSLNPEYLILQDLVVVTSDYRGGIFGFICTEDEASYGNYGLKDQLAALKWVNANIKNFGGDPDRVTISGHSSGAVSAHLHMLNPESWDLFSGAIAMSGPITSPLMFQHHQRRMAFDVGISLGIRTDNSTELIERMRKMSVRRLKDAQELVALVTFPDWLVDGIPFSPSIEKEHKDAFLTKSPVELMKNGKFARVPLMTGITSNEIILFSSAIPLLRFQFLFYDISTASFPNLLDLKTLTRRREAGMKIKKEYFKSTSFVEATNDEVSQLLSDLLYTRPVTNLVKLLSKYIPVYYYAFVYENQLAKNYFQDAGYPLDPSLNGAGHMEDLIYVWKPGDQNMTSEGYELKEKIPKLWSNFARYRNPTPTVDPLLDNVTWPKVLPNEGSISYLRMDVNFSINDNFRSKYVNFLNQLTEDEE